MKLTPIQYDAIMQAINNAQNEIADDTFIDPYGENPDNYTNETLAQALEEVRDKLIDTKKTQTIVIEVQGGVVQDVRGLERNQNWQIADWDEVEDGEKTTEQIEEIIDNIK